MKTYLIRIENTDGGLLATAIYGDTPRRPFTSAGNLWTYKTPGGAARRLEQIANNWEAYGRTVNRIFGTVQDMPTKGTAHNVAATLAEYK